MAEYHLLAQHVNEARSLLERSMATWPRTYYSYDGAKCRARAPPLNRILASTGTLSTKAYGGEMAKRKRAKERDAANGETRRRVMAISTIVSRKHARKIARTMAFEVAGIAYHLREISGVLVGLGEMLGPGTDTPNALRTDPPQPPDEGA